MENAPVTRSVNLFTIQQLNKQMQSKLFCNLKFNKNQISLDDNVLVQYMTFLGPLRG